MDIVTQNDPSAIGQHNAALHASTSRIIEGATWKKQRIVVILPSGPTLPAKAMLALWNLIFPPNQAVFKYLAQGCEVGDAYSQAIEQVLANPELSQWEFILTVESDNIPPPDGVLQLIKSMEANPQFCAISGLYWTKGPGGVPQAWGDPKDPVLNFRPQSPEPGKVIEVNGIGMGFALWRIPMFKDAKLRKPWFKSPASLEEGSGTQDLYFATDAKKYGYRFGVDCSCLVGHYDHDGRFGPAGLTW